MNGKRLLGFGAISFLMLALGGVLTSLGFGPWYESLKLPPWQPPGPVFGPVWTTLLTLLAFAVARVSDPARDPEPVDPARPRLRRIALWLYSAQVLLNVLWSALFFTMHRPDLALIEIAVLDLVLLGMVVTFARLDRLAGALLLPYLLWLGLATAINIEVVRLNAPFTAG